MWDISAILGNSLTTFVCVGERWFPGKPVGLTVSCCQTLDRRSWWDEKKASGIINPSLSWEDKAITTSHTVLKLPKGNGSVAHKRGVRRRRSFTRGVITTYQLIVVRVIADSRNKSVTAKTAVTSQLMNLSHIIICWFSFICMRNRKIINCTEEHHFVTFDDTIIGQDKRIDGLCYHCVNHSFTWGFDLSRIERHIKFSDWAQLKICCHWKLKTVKFVHLKGLLNSQSNF